MTNDKNGKEESDTESFSQVNVSRRRVAASILGLGGLSLITSNANAHGGSKPRRWKQDVDAQGHDLLNLGSLGLQNTSSEITNLTGRNLTIDNGTLHSESASLWEDTDSDGLLEASDYGGIDVGTANVGTFVQSNGDGKETERVLLDTYEDDNNPTAFDWDSGELSTVYDIYTLKYVMWGTSGPAPLGMQIQGDTGRKYRTTHNSGRTYSDQKIWYMGWLKGDTAIHGKVTLRGGNSPIEGATRKVIADFEGGDTSDRKPVSGVYEDKVGSVNQIRIFTPNTEAFGKLALWGENLTL